MCARVRLASARSLGRRSCFWRSSHRHGRAGGITRAGRANGANAKVSGYALGEEYEQAILTAVLSLTQDDEITIVNGDADDDAYGNADAYLTFFEGSLLTRT